MIDPSFYKVYYLNQDSSEKKFIEVGGVENLSIDTNLSLNDPYVLGGIYSAYQINAPIQTSLSFDRSFVECDLLYSFTGSDPVNQLFIYNGNQYYKMQCLYLQQYSAAFSVGSLPKLNNKFISYGYGVENSDFLKLDTPKLNAKIETSKCFIPRLNSISLSGDDYSNKFLKVNSNNDSIHNLYSFEYRLSANRNPFYSIGSLHPDCVESITPFQIFLTVNSKASSKYKNDTQINIKNNDFLNFSISVTGTGDGQSFNFCIQNAIMYSCSSEMSNQNTLQIKREFLGYYGI
jgi:hypothetical protein